MHVTCSNCGARYAVDPAAIGPTGRTVQCGRCSHRWFERAQATQAPPPASTPQQSPVPDVVIRPRSPGAGLPALTPAPPQRRRGPWLTGAAALVLLLLGSAAFVWRDRLPATWRPILTLDAFRGPSATSSKTPSASEARLEINLDASKIEWIDGRYVVQGEVVNSGRAPGSTSRLRLTFRKDSDVLGERAYPLVKGPIGPGGRVSFSQALDEPPPGTTDVVPTVE